MTTTPSLDLTVPPEYTPYAFAALGIILIGIGIFSWKKVLNLSRHGVRTSAVFTRMKTSRRLSSGKQELVAVYTYTDSRGREHEFIQSCSDSFQSMPITGQNSITVRYDPARPEEAMVEGTALLSPIIFTLMGIAFIGYGISQLL